MSDWGVGSWAALTVAMAIVGAWEPLAAMVLYFTVAAWAQRG